MNEFLPQHKNNIRNRTELVLTQLKLTRTILGNYLRLSEETIVNNHWQLPLAILDNSLKLS